MRSSLLNYVLWNWEKVQCVFNETSIGHGSAICIHRDLLPEEAVASHVITCQGRDHLVNIQSIVTVHMEPELTLRQLRGRLRLIHPHWPACSSVVCVILGDFNICDSEEGRFNVWNQPFTDGGPGKDCCVPFFLSIRPWGCPIWWHKKRCHSPSCHTHSFLDWSYFYQSTHGLKHEISVVILMSLETWWRKLFRVTTLQYASSFRNLQI